MSASLLLLLSPLLPQGPDEAVRIERRLAAMGTDLTIEVEARDRRTALQASERAARAIEAAEARLSTWRDDTELSRLNAAPIGEGFGLSEELAAELTAALHWSRETGGAFDPTLGAVVEAWDLRGEGRRPSNEELALALSHGGFGALELDGRTAVRRSEGMRIEEGGFGKGAGLDAALAAVAGDGVYEVVVDLGGQVALTDGASVSWSVADPRDREHPAVSFRLERGSVATSGNSERGLMVDGERIGHLLDPRTGRPAADFGSMTVWAADATAADCLSTGLYVMGPDAALEWAAEREGIEVLIMEVHGDTLIARATAGWVELHPLLEDVVVERRTASASAGMIAAGAVTAAAALQEPTSEQATDERVDELERRIDVVAEDLERQELGSVLPPIGDGMYGLGPAASKIYSVQEGVSIGGYGEGVYSNPESGTATADFLRAVLYFGYRFDDKWLFNSEIEFEHASTSESGSVSVEFAYLDYLARDEVNGRAGLLLVPMGIYNELHEPTTFLPALRPEVEQKIIPSTWRENGAGVFGGLGPVDYRAYVVNGLDAGGFDDTGLRGGRQKGSKAKAEELAFVGRADWRAMPGITLGGAFYYGDSSQDTAGVEVPTTIFDAHVMAHWRAWTLRGLYAMASLDNVDDLNTALGYAGTQSVGEQLDGYYVELGFDFLGAFRPNTGKSLTPFLRWEKYNTQADVPTGWAADPANDVEILTYGIAYQPNNQVIFKLDYQDQSNEAGTGVNRLNIAMGYVF